MKMNNNVLITVFWVILLLLTIKFDELNPKVMLGFAVIIIIMDQMQITLLQKQQREVNE